MDVVVMRDLKVGTPRLGLHWGFWWHFSIGTEEQELDSSWVPSSWVILGMFVLESLSQGELRGWV